MAIKLKETLFEVLSELCMSHICHATHKEFVMSHLWMSQATHMTESFDAWVMSCIWMSQGTYMNESCHISARTPSLMSFLFPFPFLSLFSNACSLSLLPPAFSLIFCMRVYQYYSISLSLSFYPCINLSIHISIYLSIYLSVHRSIYLSVNQSINLSIYPPIHLSTSLYIHQCFVYQSIQVSIFVCRSSISRS